MSRVKVILDNGHEVVVDGANSAQWYDQPLGPGNTRKEFEVSYHTDNSHRVMARFDAAHVVGYVFDPENR